MKFSIANHNSSSLQVMQLSFIREAINHKVKFWIQFLTEKTNVHAYMYTWLANWWLKNQLNSYIPAPFCLQTTSVMQLLFKFLQHN